MSLLFNTFFSRAATAYRGVLGGRLQAMGIKYDDLLVEKEDMQIALSRCSDQAKLERIRRAFDASLKKKTIPAECHNYDPFDLYLQPGMEQARFERMEKAILDA